MKPTLFLIALAAASLAACGQSEQAPAVAEAPVAEPAPVASPAPEQPAAEPAAPVAAEPATVEAAAPVAAEPATAASASAAKPDLAHGEKIYRQACAFCHDKGVAGAPKAGDVAAWSPRLAQGMDALYTAAVRGKGTMPAKGGNPSLADADVKAAVDYLVAQSR